MCVICVSMNGCEGKKTMKRTGILLPEGLLEDLWKESKSKGTNLSETVRVILRDYFDQDRKGGGDEQILSRLDGIDAGLRRINAELKKKKGKR